jgi:hypothetical protein
MKFLRSTGIERMGQGNIGDGLDFRHLQYPQIGLPSVELIKSIVVGTEVGRHPELPSNGAVEHPTESDTIDLSRMDAEPNDPARALIHDDQDRVGPQRGRLTSEQIHTPEAVFHVAQESQPRGTTGVLARPVVIGSLQEPFEPRLCRFGCGTTRRCVGRFADSPSRGYVASFPRPHG